METEEKVDEPEECSEVVMKDEGENSDEQPPPVPAGTTDGEDPKTPTVDQPSDTKEPTAAVQQKSFFKKNIEDGMDR